MYGANESAVSEDKDKPRFIRITDINEDGSLKDTTFKSLDLEKAKPYLLKKNDILFARTGATVGKTYIHSNDELSCFAGYLIKFESDINKLLPKLLFYYSKTIEYQDWIRENTIQATIQNVSAEKYKELKLPIFKMNEQNIVISFLDRKLSDLNFLIYSKEKQIKLLEEQRQAMITEAITKGLNPNVKMKDSGVDWIGEIPEHWEVTKIKYTTYVKGRIGWQGLRSDEFIDDGPSLVTGTDFKNGKIDWQTCYHVSEERYNEAVPIQLKEDDLLITKDGTIGKLALVKEMPERAILNSGIFVTRPLMNQYINSYLYWNLTSAPFSQYIRTMETGSTIKHLYQETFVNYSYALPPKYEQESISYYLNNETQKLETIKQSMLNQISKLKEYRQSLIHEAVTGKIPIEEMETYLKEVEKNGG